MHYELTDRFEVPAAPSAVWEFFSNAHNLPLITPPWLGFSVKTTGEIRIEQDTLLDYTVRWCGLAVRWRTRIIDWSPPRQFVDLQLRGPYTLWHHQHTFMPTPRGVACMDRVIYKLPLGIVGRLAHALVVRRQLLEIFRFRRKAIAEHLGGMIPIQPDVQISTLR